MNYFRIIGVLVLSSFILAGCESELGPGEALYTTLGMISKAGDVIIIEDDKGDILQSNQSNLIKDFEVNQGMRITAEFTISDEVAPSGVDYLVYIYNIDEVLLKPIVQEKFNSRADTLGDDPLIVKDVWISKDFLNVDFNFLGGNVIHYINMLEVDCISDTVHLELKHDSHYDSGSMWLNALVSFKLESIQNNEQDSILIKVTATEFEQSEYQQYLWYCY